MKNIVPEFVIGADNVYRTKNYIIKQVIFLDKSLSENNSITSFDTFYLRNRKRDVSMSQCLQIKVTLMERDCQAQCVLENM